MVVVTHLCVCLMMSDGRMMIQWIDRSTKQARGQSFTQHPITTHIP
jgi:hypothetical protein